MEMILKLGLTGVSIALMGCSTTYQADPTTFAHLSCEQLKSMYDPDSSLVIPNIPDQHPGDSNYVGAQAPARKWTYEEDLREEKSKFRSDVRAAYRKNNCAAVDSPKSGSFNQFESDENDTANKLASIGIDIETLKDQVRTEVAWQKSKTED